MQSTIISIISVVIAAISAGISIYTNMQNRKINSINIKARYFEKIFDKYLIEEIPKTRDYIRFTNEGYLEDFQPLVGTLSDMVKKANFFKYDNRNFYNNLKNKTRDLEDYLTQCGNRTYEYDEQSEVHKKISDMTMEVYSCISNYYLGL